MNLTTLANVKMFANSTVTSAQSSPADDAFLNMLIAQASNMIGNYIGRANIARATYNEIRSGACNQTIMLKNWPVISVSNVVVGAVTVPAQQSFGQDGFYLQPADQLQAGMPQNVYLSGYAFERGMGNVKITYQAGYCIQSEPWVIPTTPNLTPTQPLGAWCQDDGVTYATGAALAMVASGPAQGQYSVTQGAGGATYSFNVADIGKAILVSYSYVPFDIAQACIETVTERYQYKQHVGMKSKGQAQSTTTYDNSGLNQYSKMILEPYRLSFPL